MHGMEALVLSGEGVVTAHSPEDAEREAAYEAFELAADPKLEGRDYSFYRLWFATGYSVGRAAGRAEGTNELEALLEAADTLCQLHGVEPGTVSTATVAEAVERLTSLVAEVRAEAVTA